MMRTTSYLPAERLLARYPGRLAAISSAMAACYRALGLPVPDRLMVRVDEGRIISYNEAKREEE